MFTPFAKFTVSMCAAIELGIGLGSLLVIAAGEPWPLWLVPAFVGLGSAGVLIVMVGHMGKD
jgi:hypothetical protein